MNSQQLGKFSLDEFLVRENPEIVAEAFKDMQFVAVRAETLFSHQEIEYAGISSKFEEVPKGMCILGYRVDISINQAEGEAFKYSHVEVTKL